MADAKREEEERLVRKRKLDVFLVSELVQRGNLLCVPSNTRDGRAPNSFFQRLDWTVHCARMDDATFRRFYRMGKGDFNVLLGRLRAHFM